MAKTSSPIKQIEIFFVKQQSEIKLEADTFLTGVPALTHHKIQAVIATASKLLFWFPAGHHQSQSRFQQRHCETCSLSIHLWSPKI